MSLTSLVAWWSVFIRTSIVDQYHSRLENLEANLKFHALRLGYSDQVRLSRVFFLVMIAWK